MKINAEEKSYERLATAYVNARKDDIIIRLASQRASRAREAADVIMADGKAPTRSDIITLLQDYAKADFDMTRSLFQEGMDSRSRFLADLEDLEIELQRIKLLRETLTELAKPDSDVKRLKATAEAIAKTKEATTKLFSADSKSAVKESKSVTEAAADTKGKKTDRGTNGTP